MKRLWLFAALAFASWMLMQGVHELGHVLAAWLTGGTVERVVLHPLTISRTDVSPNPRPLVVAWGGPLAGVAIPLLLAGCCKFISRRCQPYVDFFAGFCLIANGAYIGAGSITHVGDAGDMLRHGSPRWLLASFGTISAAWGLWIWHRATLKPK
jgi:hypothetical protein